MQWGLAVNPQMQYQFPCSLFCRKMTAIFKMGYSITAVLKTVNKRCMLMSLSDLEIGKKKKQSHVSFAGRREYADGQHSKRRGSVHSKNFFFLQKKIFVILKSVSVRASFNNRRSCWHASVGRVPFSSYKTRRNYSRTLWIINFAFHNRQIIWLNNYWLLKTGTAPWGCSSGQYPVADMYERGYETWFHKIRRIHRLPPETVGCPQRRLEYEKS